MHFNNCYMRNMHRGTKKNNQFKIQIWSIKLGQGVNLRVGRVIRNAPIFFLISMSHCFTQDCILFASFAYKMSAERLWVLDGSYAENYVKDVLFPRKKTTQLINCTSPHFYIRLIRMCLQSIDILLQSMT